MAIVLILFFISLGSLALMIVQRVNLMRAGQIVVEEYSPLVPDAIEVRYIMVKHIKKYGFIIISNVLRFSIRSSILVQKQTEQLKSKIKDRLTRHYHANPEQKKEVSGFLKTVSEYKQKIKNLKNRIKEEESKY